MNTMAMVRNKKGLTLIELLAVIVILGVIAAIAVPAIGGIISKSKVDADAQSVALIQSAAEMWALQQDTVTSPVSVFVLSQAGFLSSNSIKVQSGDDAGDYYSSVVVTVTNGVVKAGEVSKAESAPSS